MATNPDKIPFRAETFHRETAFHLTRFRRYKDALQRIDESLNLAPNHAETLLRRALINQCQTNNREALKDLGKASKVYKDSGSIKRSLPAEQARVTFLCGDFESSLVQYYDGLRNEEKPSVYVDGVLQSEGVIRDCIGPSAGHPLRDFSATIAQIHDHQQQQELLRKQRLKWTPPEPQDTPAYFPMTSSNVKLTKKPNFTDDDGNVWRPVQPRTTNLQNKISEKYLGRLNSDRKFFEKLVMDPRLKGFNQTTFTSVKTAAQGALKTLRCLQEQLRERKPYYSIRYAEIESTKSLEEKKFAQMKRFQARAKKHIENIIDELKKNLRARRFNETFDMLEHAKDHLDATQKNILPKKAEYMDLICQIAAQTNIETKIFDWKIAPEMIKRMIGVILGVTNVSGSLENLNIVTQHTPAILKKKIRDTQTRLKDAKTKPERVWLLHDLAKYHVDQKKLDRAQYYANLSLQEEPSVEWTVNNLFIMCKAQILQRNRNEAKETVEKAREWAGKLSSGYSAKILTFFEKVNEMIDTLDVDKQTDAIKAREKAIVTLMKEGGSIEEEVKGLFGKMSQLPAYRRMSIMPGVRVDNDDYDRKRKSRQSIAK